MILLTVVPSAITAVSDANAYSQGNDGGLGPSENGDPGPAESGAIGQPDLPADPDDDRGPDRQSGFAVRVQTEAFGKSRWDQWMVNTTTHVLQEQEWSTTWVTGNAVPAWNTDRLGHRELVDGALRPSHGVHRSPQTLAVDFQVSESLREQVPGLRAQDLHRRLQHALHVESHRGVRHRSHAGELDVTRARIRRGPDERGGVIVLVLVLSMLLMGILAVALSTSDYAGTLSTAMAAPPRPRSPPRAGWRSSSAPCAPPASTPAFPAGPSVAR